jgi:hypothetical protein
LSVSGSVPNNPVNISAGAPFDDKKLNLAVLLQWTYSYFAYKRGACIITHLPPRTGG